MSKRPWYKRYPADFIAATLEMSLEEKGAYSIVLDLMYDKGGRIPDDSAWIARVCGCSTRRWNQIRDRLIEAGKIEERGDWLTNKRVKNELKLSEQEYEELSAAGRKGAEKTNEKRAESREINDITEKRLTAGPVDAENDDPAVYLGKNEQKSAKTSRDKIEKNGGKNGEKTVEKKTTLPKNNNIDKNRPNGGPPKNERQRARDTRNHIPESPYTPLSPEHDAQVRAVVDGFLNWREEYWPNWPNLPAPTMTLETQARSYLTEGADAQTIIAAVTKRMKAMAEAGEPAPTNLGFVRLSVQSAAAKANAQEPPRQSYAETERATRRARLKSLIEHEVWKDEWGDKLTIEDAKAELQGLDRDDKC